MSERLIDLGLQLGELYRSAAEARLQDWQCSQDIDKRKVEITPADGWPGKNDKERRAAEDRAYLDDMIIQTGLIDLAEIKADLAKIDGQVAALEAERRSLEWSIRAQMVSALTQARVDTNNGRGDPTERAFDDALQAEFDQAVWDEIPF